jgi:hypothetical protein
MVGIVFGPSIDEKRGVVVEVDSPKSIWVTAVVAVFASPMPNETL